MTRDGSWETGYEGPAVRHGAGTGPFCALAPPDAELSCPGGVPAEGVFCRPDHLEANHCEDHAMRPSKALPFPIDYPQPPEHALSLTCVPACAHGARLIARHVVVPPSDYGGFNRPVPPPESLRRGLSGGEDLSWGRLPGADRPDVPPRDRVEGGGAGAEVRAGRLKSRRPPVSRRDWPWKARALRSRPG